MPCCPTRSVRSGTSRANGCATDPAGGRRAGTSGASSPRGSWPRELGELGFFRMQLPGIGDLGAVAYGLVELELEAGDSGLRSVRLRPERARDVRDPRVRSDEQKAHWLPRMASGRRDRLLRSVGADSGSDLRSMRTTARRDGADWIVSGTKMCITNGGCPTWPSSWANTDDGSVTSWCRATCPGSARPTSTGRCRLRAVGDPRSW